MVTFSKTLYKLLTIFLEKIQQSIYKIADPEIFSLYKSVFA